MLFSLPNLPYGFSALEPYIDAQTMELHHDKHHATYVAKLNAALEKAPQLEDWSLEALLKKLPSVPESIRPAVRNHGGGHYNHSLFWKIMGPPGGSKPSGELLSEINQHFHSFDTFKEQFSTAAVNLFGSGWSWLVWKDGKLALTTTPNQDNPLTNSQIPILGLDVWEHAYYLRYQNRRQDYVDAWWHVVNWEEVAEIFKKAKNSHPH